MFRDLWLDWFFSESIPYDLPPGEKREALDNIVSIGRMIQSKKEDEGEGEEDEEKEAQNVNLIRKGELALTMLPMAFPNWDAEVRQLCETPLNADTWGQRIAKVGFFCLGTSCGWVLVVCRALWPLRRHRGKRKWHDLGQQCPLRRLAHL